MAEKDPNKRPIIIKKVKKGGHGHHGGAWKVAYADFVTAMMAFFLLLWLLSSTPEETLKGIADYFTPTTGIRDAVGIGFEGGLTPNTPGKIKSDTSTPGIVSGQSPSGSTPNSPENQSVNEATQDGELFKAAQEEVRKALVSDPSMREFADNILVEQTPEGLKIDIMGSDKHPFYVRGTAEISAHGQKILAKMKDIIDKMPNFISITGHTDATNEAGGRADYTSWELSTDRAHAARRYLLKVGMAAERTQKIVGMADKELIDVDDPRSPKNRRVTIILLRESHMTLSPQYLPSDRDILSVSPQSAPPKPINAMPKGAAPSGGRLMGP